jgi:hypothetical protein
MYLRDIFFIMIFVTVVFTGMSIFISDFLKKGGKDIQMPELNYLKTVSERANEIENTIKSTQTSFSILDIPFAVLSGIYQVFRLILDGMATLYLSLRNTIAIYLGLPSWFVDAIVGAISIFVLFEIISIVTKQRT